ncbi:MAG: pyridoxal phosphate-dependent aminotransferase [Spirochaetales bacterium]|nr:pyridoxal phosphate-dependent aminotransferase [Spirochaetales bacterium]
MDTHKKSYKLKDVCYDIRGPVLKEAKRLESEGYEILKLHIGNPPVFGFDIPDEIMKDIVNNLKNAQGYIDSKGLLSARLAIQKSTGEKQINGVDAEDVYIGNGVSELIVMAMQGLLNDKDEVLIPAPDYPLWTAAVNLSGGKAVHYICDENSHWYPDLKDIRRKITGKTKAIVIINPNNPTGAVYPEAILMEMIKLAAEHNLIVFSDEIYDKILYDDTLHQSPASLSDDILCVTFNGLSKNYQATGLRAGWMVLSGDKKNAKDYIEGLDILASMRLCSNVPAQYGIQTALAGYQNIQDHVAPGGRLREQRDLCHAMLNDMPGVSCVKPRGTLYMFPRIDAKKFNIKNDQKFVLDLLLEKKILVVQGTGFNWPAPDHVRIVFLPPVETLKKAMTELKDFLKSYRQE